MKNNHGFGLVEVMVALLIMSVGIVGVFQVLQLIVRQDAQLHHMSQALSLAQSHLEQIHASAAEDSIPAEERPPYQITVSRQAVSSDGRLERVTVVVSWPDIRGKLHSLKLSTRVQTYK